MLADDPGGRKGRPGWGVVRGERCRREDEALHVRNRMNFTQDADTHHLGVGTEAYCSVVLGLSLL